MKRRLKSFTAALLITGASVGLTQAMDVDTEFALKTTLILARKINEIPKDTLILYLGDDLPILHVPLNRINPDTNMNLEIQRLITEDISYIDRLIEKEKETIAELEAKLKDKLKDKLLEITNDLKNKQEIDQDIKGIDDAIEKSNRHKDKLELEKDEKIKIMHKILGTLEDPTMIESPTSAPTFQTQSPKNAAEEESFSFSSWGSRFHKTPPGNAAEESFSRISQKSGPKMQPQEVDLSQLSFEEEASLRSGIVSPPHQSGHEKAAEESGDEIMSTGSEKSFSISVISQKPDSEANILQTSYTVLKPDLELIQSVLVKPKYQMALTKIAGDQGGLQELMKEFMRHNQAMGELRKAHQKKINELISLVYKTKERIASFQMTQWGRAPKVPHEDSEKLRKLLIEMNQQVADLNAREKDYIESLERYIEDWKKKYNASYAVIQEGVNQELRKAEEDKRREAEEQRRRKAEEEHKAKEERLRKAEEDKRREAEEEKRKAEEDKRREAEEEKRKEEEDKRREAEEEKRKAEEDPRAEDERLKKRKEQRDKKGDKDIIEVDELYKLLHNQNMKIISQYSRIKNDHEKVLEPLTSKVKELKDSGRQLYELSGLEHIAFQDIMRIINLQPLVDSLYEILNENREKISNDPVIQQNYGGYLKTLQSLEPKVKEFKDSGNPFYELSVLEERAVKKMMEILISNEYKNLS